MRLSPFWRNWIGWLGSAAIALAALLSGSAARAASFDLVGTTQPYTLQGDFNPNWTAVPQGFSGSGAGTNINVLYSATPSGSGLGITGAGGGQVSLTYTLLGYSSSLISQAGTSLNVPMFQTSSTPNGTSFTTTASGSGLVPLIFDSSAFGGASGMAINGGAIGSNVAIGFLIDSANPGIAYALFNGSWQNGNGNFDNMIVGLQIDPADPPATPLPAALPLFATGLGVIGALGLRRKRRIQAPQAPQSAGARTGQPCCAPVQTEAPAQTNALRP